ncbi:hypothetical protein ACLB2K_045681 [Fragaria x ananassa]
MVITGNDNVEMDRLQRQLAFGSKMKDLGDLKYLGIKVARGSEVIYFCSRKYILDMLMKTDADWAGILTGDRHQVTLSFVGGNLVTWKSKKQNVVAPSSVKAECKGMAYV